MKHDIAMQWVAALRSGKYKQGKNYLRKADNYCCLGVLCDLLGTAKEPSEGSNIYRFAGETSSLPEIIADVAGIKDTLGYVHYGPMIKGHYSTLSAANDLGVSFADIADYIELNYEHL